MSAGAKSLVPRGMDGFMSPSNSKRKLTKNCLSIDYIRMIMPQAPMLSHAALSNLKKYRHFILFVTLVCIAAFVLEIINQRFWLNDFKVYVDAADALKTGQQVYGRSFGLDTGFYKYSPVVLLLFVPATYVPFTIAAAVHFFIIVILTLLALLFIAKISNYNTQKPNLLLSLAFVCIVNHLMRELHLGNVNMAIVCLLSAFIFFDQSQRPVLAGLCFAFAILIKPYLLVLAVPVLLHRRIKTLVWSAVWGIVAVLLFTVLYGFQQSVLLHKDWLHAMMAHNIYLQSNHTIAAITNYFGIHILQQSHQLYLLAALLCAYCAYFMLKVKSDNYKAYHNAFFVLLALLPNILITDTEHFLFALPIIYFILEKLFIVANPYLTGVFTIIVFCYGANSSDLLGNQLSDKFEAIGLLGIANMMLVILFLYIQKLEKTK